MQAANFADRLTEAVTRKQSQLAVGLDPRLDPVSYTHLTLPTTERV